MELAGVDWAGEGARCVDLLGRLVREPTVNRGTGGADDGHESRCAELLAEELRAAGLEPALREKVKGRASVVARLRGTGERPPLLLNAHLDVVEADASQWRVPPFSGAIQDGYLWGRGAIDMKHMAAMSVRVVALYAEAVRAGLVPKPTRDVIVAGVADEEAGCDLGARFLVDEHPELVRAEYVLGEIGAFSTHLFGRTFYPVQVAEKGTCWVRATARGEPGHGSMPNPDSAVLRLARALERLGRGRLPMHPVPAVHRFLDEVSARLPTPQRQVMRRLKTPQAAALVLDWLVRDVGQRRSFGAMLSNTASPTVVRAGDKTNVIPGKATAEIDGRVLPGQSEAAFLAELAHVLDDGRGEVELEVLRWAPPVEASPDTALFAHLAATLRAHDPTGHPVPFLIPGFTDAKAYSRLGATCYGFAPVQFDPAHEVSFTRMYHGHDERVPVAGLAWGLRVLFDAVTGFAGALRRGAPPPAPCPEVFRSDRTRVRRVASARTWPMAPRGPDR